jgi:hypothetical protein
LVKSGTRVEPLPLQQAALIEVSLNMRADEPQQSSFGGGQVLAQWGR